MPAVAFRHPEIEENAAPVNTAQELQPSPAPTQWEDYASYVDQFAGHRRTEHNASEERPFRRTRRHQHFRLSSVFCAGTLLMCELVALVWLYALDLQSIRYSNQLDRDIKTTSLEIARSQDKIASQNAAPRLNTWATQFGYHKAMPHDMDDVTSSAPMPAPVEDEKN